jgi:hypothetical protein
VSADERLEQVQLLRRQGHSPKQIARKLAITPAEAGRLIRAASAASPAEVVRPALIGCWISPNWSTDLVITGDHPDWPLHTYPESGTTGLVAVLVAREHRHGKVSVCTYLCDVYCLGVKNADGPDIMDHVELRPFRFAFFSGFEGEPLQAPIELARELVLGSIDHARGRAPSPSARTANPSTSPGPTTNLARSSAPWNAPPERAITTTSSSANDHHQTRHHAGRSPTTGARSDSPRRSGLLAPGAEPAPRVA